MSWRLHNENSVPRRTPASARCRVVHLALAGTFGALGPLSELRDDGQRILNHIVNVMHFFRRDDVGRQDVHDVAEGPQQHASV